MNMKRKTPVRDLVVETREFDKDVLWVRLKGKLDIKTNLNFHDRISVSMHDAIHDLVLEIPGLNHIDSLGLAEITSLRRELMKRGGDIIIVAPSLRVRNLLELVRIIPLKSIFENKKDAKSHLGI